VPFERDAIEFEPCIGERCGRGIDEEGCEEGENLREVEREVRDSGELNLLGRMVGLASDRA
jgi:hypothetical protein